MQFGLLIANGLKDWLGTLAGVTVILVMVAILGWIGSLVMESEYEAQLDACVARSIRAGETIGGVVPRCKDQVWR